MGKTNKKGRKKDTMAGTLITLGDGEIGLIIGRRGSGKSALGFKIIEEMHKKHEMKKFYVIGIPDVKHRYLPAWLKPIKSLDAVPNGSVVIIEEAGLAFSAYKRARRDLTLYVIQTARHKEISLLFVNLNTATVDVNVIRSADIIYVKRPSLLQSQMERVALRRILLQAEVALKKKPDKDMRSWSYVTHADGAGLMRNQLPSFWTEALSKSYENGEAVPLYDQPLDVREEIVKRSLPSEVLNSIPEGILQISVHETEAPGPKGGGSYEATIVTQTGNTVKYKTSFDSDFNLVNPERTSPQPGNPGNPGTEKTDNFALVGGEVIGYVKGLGVPMWDDYDPEEKQSIKVATLTKSQYKTAWDVGENTGGFVVKHQPNPKAQHLEGGDPGPKQSSPRDPFEEKYKVGTLNRRISDGKLFEIVDISTYTVMDGGKKTDYRLHLVGMESDMTLPVDIQWLDIYSNIVRDEKDPYIKPAKGVGGKDLWVVMGWSPVNDKHIVMVEHLTEVDAQDDLPHWYEATNPKHTDDPSEKNLYIPDQPETESWFAILDTALIKYSLPESTGSLSRARKATSDEFMLMDVTVGGWSERGGWGGKRARFKHKESRNYLYLSKSGKIATPVGASFMKGTFPRSYSEGPDEIKLGASSSNPGSPSTMPDLESKEHKVIEHFLQFADITEGPDFFYSKHYKQDVADKYTHLLRSVGVNATTQFIRGITGKEDWGVWVERFTPEQHAALKAAYNIKESSAPAGAVPAGTTSTRPNIYDPSRYRPDPMSTLTEMWKNRPKPFGNLLDI